MTTKTADVNNENHAPLVQAGPPVYELKLDAHGVALILNGLDELQGKQTRRFANAIERMCMEQDELRKKQPVTPAPTQAPTKAPQAVPFPEPEPTKNEPGKK